MGAMAPFLAFRHPRPPSIVLALIVLHPPYLAENAGRSWPQSGSSAFFPKTPSAASSPAEYSSCRRLIGAAKRAAASCSRIEAPSTACRFNSHLRTTSCPCLKDQSIPLLCPETICGRLDNYKPHEAIACHHHGECKQWGLVSVDSKSRSSLWQRIVSHRTEPK